MDILNNPLYRPALDAVRAGRNGLVYGGKIRFSHALVINLLYSSGPLKPRLIKVLQATKNHAEVLTGFAVIYKLVSKLLANESVLGKENHYLISFLSGCFGSYIVYSHNFDFFSQPITHQITLYCFSRVVIAVGKIALDMILNCYQPNFKNFQGENIQFRNLSTNQQKKLKLKFYNKSWKYFAILVWGLVMFIYDYQPQYLQSSLRHSMAYIYDTEVDSWSSWREFLGF